MNMTLHIQLPPSWAKQKFLAFFTLHLKKVGTTFFHSVEESSNSLLLLGNFLRYQYSKESEMYKKETQYSTNIIAVCTEIVDAEKTSYYSI